MTVGQRVKINSDSAFNGWAGTVVASASGTLTVQLDGYPAPLPFAESEVVDRLLTVVPTARVGVNFPGLTVVR
jgi:hypothetical protein